MKQCNVCNEIKPLTEYFKQAHAADGKRGDCKVCCAASRRKWTKDNPEKYQAQLARRKTADWYKDPKHFINKISKQRDRRKELCDSYVIQLITSPGTVGEKLVKEDITQELIDAYRVAILLKRALRLTNPLKSNKNPKKEKQ